MNKRILIVEKNSSDEKILKSIFELRKDEAIVVSDETKALHTFKSRGPFDLVLIEALLPKIPGSELCSDIKATPEGADTPVVIMGSLMKSFKLVHEAKIKHFAADTIVKPFDLEDLGLKLSVLLDGEQYSLEESEMYLDEEELAEKPDLKASFKDWTDYAAIHRYVPLSGSLTSIPFPRVLGILYRSGEDGILTVEGGEITKSIYWHKGKPIYVSSSVRQESLGHMLVEEGIINQETLEQSFQLMISTGQMQGEALIEMGAITPHELFDAVTRQIEQKILDIFGWNEGHYKFTLDDFNYSTGFSVDLDIVSLIIKGVTQYWGKSTLEIEFKDKAHLTVYPVKNNFDELLATQNKPSKRRFLQKINGIRTLGELQHVSEMRELETFQFLFSCILLDAIVLGPANLGVTDESGKMYRELDPPFKVYGSKAAKDCSQIIQDKYYYLRNKNYFEIFELDPSTLFPPDEEIYLELLNGLEKDKLPSELDDLSKMKADYCYAKITKAWETLQTQTGRAQYLDSIASVQGIAKEASNIIQSEIEYQNGIKAFEKRDFVSARSHFAKARNLHPSAADYIAMLGASIYMGRRLNNIDDLESATKTLNEAIEVNPNIDLPYVWLAHLAKDQGNIEYAQENYEKALEVNPNCAEALTALHSYYQAQISAEEESSPKDKSTEMIDFEFKINQQFDRLYSQNFFDILNINENSSSEEMRQSYFILSAAYHPSQLITKTDKKIKEKAEEIFVHLTEAYFVLADSDRRREYINNLIEEADILKDVDTTEQKAEESKQIFLNGLQLVGKEKFKSAVNYFKNAVLSDRHNTSALAWLGYAEYMAHRENESQRNYASIKARKFAQKAIIANPESEDGYLTLAKLYARDARETLALELFEKVLQLNPQNLEALKGFGLIILKSRQAKKAVLLQKRTTKLERLSKRLDADIKKIQEMEYYKILGATRAADSNHIQEAYQKKKKEYSEETLGVIEDESIQKKLAEIHTLLDNAFNVLSKPNFRTEYDQDLSAKARNARYDVSKVNSYTKAMELGEELINQKDYDLAYQIFQKAMELKSEATEPKAYLGAKAYLGYIIYMRDPTEENNRLEGLSVISDILKKDKRNIIALTLMARIDHYRGDLAMAAVRYKQILSLQPNNIEATRFLNIQGKRMQESNLNIFAWIWRKLKK